MVETISENDEKRFKEKVNKLLNFPSGITVPNA